MAWEAGYRDLTGAELARRLGRRQPWIIPVPLLTVHEALVDQAVTENRSSSLTGAALIHHIIDDLLVIFGAEILQIPFRTISRWIAGSP